MWYMPNSRPTQVPASGFSDTTVAGLPTPLLRPLSTGPSTTIPACLSWVNAVEIVDLASPVDSAISRELRLPRWLRARTILPAGVATALSESNDFSSGSDIICSSPRVDSINMFILEQIRLGLPRKSTVGRKAQGSQNKP